MEFDKELNIALYRTGLEVKDRQTQWKIIEQDIKLNFPRKKTEFIKQAIRNGGTGKYGISYKFTIQLVLYWIHSKIKEDKIKSSGML